MTVILIIVVKVLSESYLTRTVYCNLKYFRTRIGKIADTRRLCGSEEHAPRSASPGSAQADGGVVKCVLFTFNMPTGRHRRGSVPVSVWFCLDDHLARLCTFGNFYKTLNVILRRPIPPLPSP